jgi:hypothetical protein
MITDPGCVAAPTMAARRVRASCVAADVPAFLRTVLPAEPAGLEPVRAYVWFLPSVSR